MSNLGSTPYRVARGRRAVVGDAARPRAAEGTTPAPCLSYARAAISSSVLAGVLRIRVLDRRISREPSFDIPHHWTEPGEARARSSAPSSPDAPHAPGGAITRRRVNHVLTIALFPARGERKPIIDHVPTMVSTIENPSNGLQSGPRSDCPPWRGPVFQQQLATGPARRRATGSVPQMISDAALIGPVTPRLYGNTQSSKDQYGHNSCSNDEKNAIQEIEAARLHRLASLVALRFCPVS
jgi:hypothetical protein